MSISRQLEPPVLECGQDGPIDLHLAGGQCYVWDVKDVKRLRVDHHICGSLQGTLPQVSQQNVFLGLPLQLLPEEVAVLVNNRWSMALMRWRRFFSSDQDSFKGLARLIDDAAAHQSASLSQAREYSARRVAEARKQQDMTHSLEMEKQKHMKETFSDEIEKKRQARRDKKAAKALTLETEEISNSEETARTPVKQAGPIGTVQADYSKIPYSVTISGSSANSPWYSSSENHIYETLESASDAGVYPFASQSQYHKNDPATYEALRKARIAVFEDLWKKGYYLGSGLKFGGDYLVYPGTQRNMLSQPSAMLLKLMQRQFLFDKSILGDPLRFHSHFTCLVLPTPLSAIEPLDIVAWGRLATAVKKCHLLAAIDWHNDTEPAKGYTASYMTLEWAGFG